MRKDWDFLKLLLQLFNFIWTNRTRVTIEISMGTWGMGDRGYLWRKPNGSRTFKFDVNGGSRETRMYVIDAAEIAGGFHKVYKAP